MTLFTKRNLKGLLIFMPLVWISTAVFSQITIVILNSSSIKEHIDDSVYPILTILYLIIFSLLFSFNRTDERILDIIEGGKQ